MKAKKIVALATGFALCFSVATASLLQAGAADVQTVTPEPVTTGYSNPKLVMYPGNVYWGNVGEITEWNPAGNPGYNYTEHVYSQYAKYATGQVIYKPLDVYLNEGREGMDHNEGVYNKDNPSLYRDALFYGTFQGVRIDYALQPKSADSNLEFRIAPGSYVASALLLSDYWMKSAPNKELYQDIDSTWKLESSADGITWTELSDVDYYWEHGDKEGNIAVSGYRTLIASAKLPDTHSYYKVTPPVSQPEDTRDKSCVLFGPTKVSSTPMDHGKKGDANANYYAASVISPIDGGWILDTISFDSTFKGVSVNYNGDVTVGEMKTLLSGNIKVMNADNSEAGNNAVIVTGMKLRVSSDDGGASWEYTITKNGGVNTTMGPNEPKKTLLPGITDYLDYDYIPSAGTDRTKALYTDYAMHTDNTWIMGTSLANRNNKHLGTFFGRIVNGAFMTWDLNNDRDVIYRVLPGSYMSTSILAHPLGLKDDGGAVSSAIYKEIAKEYIFSSSADGHTWTQIEITDDDIIPEHGFTEGALGFCSGRVCVQIPEGHRYYKITSPTTLSVQFDFSGVGPTKASKTDMHEGSGDAEVSAPVSEVYAKDITNVWLNETEKTLTVNTKASSMTVKEVLDQLATVKATVKFYDAKNNEITDTSTQFASDMTIKAFDEAGQEMLTLKTICNFVAPPEEPGFEIANQDVIQTSGDTMTVKSDSTTLQEILDSLKLKGDAEVFFFSAEGDEITDLTTLAAKDMTVGIYSAEKGELGVFTVEIGGAQGGGDQDDQNKDDQLGDNSKDTEKGPATGVATAGLAIVMLAASGAGVLISKKRNNHEKA